MGSCGFGKQEPQAGGIAGLKNPPEEVMAGVAEPIERLSCTHTVLAEVVKTKCFRFGILRLIKNVQQSGLRAESMNTSEFLVVMENLVTV